jgi:hypothetical protein
MFRVKLMQHAEGGVAASIVDEYDLVMQGMGGGLTLEFRGQPAPCFLNDVLLVEAGHHNGQ